MSKKLTFFETILYQGKVAHKGNGVAIAGSDPVQSDWNQNDPTKPDYIRNRPMFEVPSVEQVFSGKDLTFEHSGPGPAAWVGPAEDFIPLRTAEEAIITWDGIDYVCKKSILTDGGFAAMGYGNMAAMGGSDTGEPFVIALGFSEDGVNWDFSRMMVGCYDDVTVHSFDVAIDSSEVTKIPAKFLTAPDWDQNDPKQASYIRNRPFYKDVAENLVFENPELGPFEEAPDVTPTTYAFTNNEADLFVDVRPLDNFKVKFDDTVYSLDKKVFVADQEHDIRFMYIGNLALYGRLEGAPPDLFPETDEPFVVILGVFSKLNSEDPGAWEYVSVVVAAISGATHNLVIKGLTEKAIPIPQEYLPQGLISVANTGKTGDILTLGASGPEWTSVVNRAEVGM